MKLLLDTGALIAAFQEACTSRDERDAARHQLHRGILLPYLDAHPGPYVIPTVVFSEFTFGIRLDGPKEYADANFPAKFRLVPLSTRIAMIATQLREELLKGTTEEEYMKECGTIRRAFRADLYIMATCRAENCKQIVTRDTRMAPHAKRLGIPVQQIEDLGAGLFAGTPEET